MTNLKLNKDGINDTPEATAWIAGLLEGEGSFLLEHRGRGREGTPAIDLKMSDRDVVEKAALCMSPYNLRVSIDKRSHIPTTNGGRHKDLYRVRVRGYHAILLMERIFPHMGIRRRERIEELFNAWGETYSGYRCPFDFGPPQIYTADFSDL